MERVLANGLEFAYLEQGRGPLVLLLHGFPDSAYSWDQVMPAVAEAGFRAVAPFLRGYAPTAVPSDGKYDGDTLGRDVLALIAALGERQAIVVGHDWGAGAALAAAALGPERVRLLVTVGIPHPRSVKPTLKMLWTVRHFFTLRSKSAARRMARDDFAMVDELYHRWSPAWTTIPAAETAHVKEIFADPACLDAALGYYRALRVSLPTSQRLPILVPSVAFAGQHDTIPTSMYERARRCFAGPYEVVEVPGGHFMHREHPGQFTRALLRVLGEQRGPTEMGPASLHP